MKKTMKMFELMPVNGRKSFYGKAKIVQNGNSHYLLSYDTVMCGVDGKNRLHRYSDARTKTTSSHIAAFLAQFDLTQKTAKDLYALPLEKRPAVMVEL